jgi:hypothetical protein
MECNKLSYIKKFNTKIIVPNIDNNLNNYFYKCVLNKKLHPIVQEFLSLKKEDYIEKYYNLEYSKNIIIDKNILNELLSYKPSYFFWSGVDLLNIKNNENNKTNMMILETNSCPSGQKSMPFNSENNINELGYNKLMTIFLELSNNKSSKKLIPEGVLAIIYDKNIVEVLGYANQLANISNEKVYLVELYNNDKNPCAKWDENGILHIYVNDLWIKVHAVFRYVTQQPWTRIPLNSLTFVFNPILSCIAGGRNKLIAHKAYENLNDELKNSGLKIRVPYTICDVELNNIHNIIKNMNYKAVIKIPYSNAGQGVFIMHNENEYNDIFINISKNNKYEKFIIQELIDSIGTIPTGQYNDIFVWDLRMMISTTNDGYKPLVMYARKASEPLISIKYTENNINITTKCSRNIYLTNLSEKISENNWNTHSERLITLDEENFLILGITLDELIDSYIQTVLASIAIDKMAIKLWNDESKEFNKELFLELNDDHSFMEELINNK